MRDREIMVIFFSEHMIYENKEEFLQAYPLRLTAYYFLPDMDTLVIKPQAYGRGRLCRASQELSYIH